VSRLVEGAALGVADGVERREHLARELAALLDHGVDRLDVDLGMARQRLQLVDDAEQLVHHELHVAQGRRV